MKTIPIRIDHPLAAGTEIRAEDVWTFPQGLIGLPDYHRFARIALENAPPFELLAATDDPAFGLVLVDPVILVPDYELALEAEELAPLGAAEPAALEVRVPVVLPAADAPLSLNLKGPLIFAPDSRSAVQVVSRDERHAIRFEPDGASRATSCSS